MFSFTHSNRLVSFDGHRFLHHRLCRYDDFVVIRNRQTRKRTVVVYVTRVLQAYVITAVRVRSITRCVCVVYKACTVDLRVSPSSLPPPIRRWFSLSRRTCLPRTRASRGLGRTSSAACSGRRDRRREYVHVKIVCNRRNRRTQTTEISRVKIVCHAKKKTLFS